MQFFHNVLYVIFLHITDIENVPGNTYQTASPCIGNQSEYHFNKCFFKSLLGCTTVLESLRIFCWLHGSCAKGPNLMNFKTCWWAWMIVFKSIKIKTSNLFFLDNCCHWRKKIKTIFEKVPVKLDCFQGIRRFVPTLPRKI